VSFASSSLTADACTARTIGPDGLRHDIVTPICVRGALRSPHRKAGDFRFNFFALARMREEIPRVNVLLIDYSASRVAWEATAIQRPSRRTNTSVNRSVTVCGAAPPTLALLRPVTMAVSPYARTTS
jgi:hypothetical protein